MSRSRRQRRSSRRSIRNAIHKGRTKIGKELKAKGTVCWEEDAQKLVEGTESNKEALERAFGFELKREENKEKSADEETDVA